jgi:hypothetical protein
VCLLICWREGLSDERWLSDDRDPEPGLERLMVGCLTRVRPWDSGRLLLYIEQGIILVRIQGQRSEA